MQFPYNVHRNASSRINFVVKAVLDYQIATEIWRWLCFAVVWFDNTYRLVSGLLHLCFYGPLTRYIKLRVAHAPEMPGTLSPPPLASDPNMHHGTCMTHVPWCMPGSLTSGFLWRRWRGNRSPHSRCMRNPQFCVSGKRPIEPVPVN